MKRDEERRREFTVKNFHCVVVYLCTKNKTNQNK